jgi:LPS export ABC transporter protein LptC
LISCVTKEKEIAELFPEEEVNAEYAFDGYLLYSDSAKIRVKLNYDVLKKFKEENDNMTEFPEGIDVEFYDNNEVPSSWLISKYAIRNDRKGSMIARDSVVLYNADGDKLETSELLWSEKDELIYTDKFVRITQPAEKDTSYGYGFRANQDFSEFEIGKFSGLGTIPINN